MKKILFLVNHDVVIYNFRYELVEVLRNQGHEVIISSPDGERIKDLKLIGCKYIKTDVSRHGTNPIKDFSLFLTYLKILKKEKPDVVFTYTIKPNVYGGMACEIMGIPYIANITGLGTAMENGGVLQKITTTLYKVGVHKAKRIFFQNETNMKFFEEKNIISGEYTLLPGSGVNLDKFTVLDYPDNSIIKFVFIARIMKDKGIDHYLEAAKYIKKKYPDTEFHICGFCEEQYENVLKELHDSGLIHYHGMVKDIREILSKMHCTITPSYHEGMSNVLLESAASGRPCLASDVPGCRETIEDEKSGFLFEVKSTESLIEAIEKFLSLTYEEKRVMGLCGREHVEKNFDRNIVVQAYVNEINNIFTEREKYEQLV